MTAVISTTYDNPYLFCLPIVTFCWHKLGVKVICFMPYLSTEDENKKIDCVNDALRSVGLKVQYAGFDAPEHKKATYTQCSRLYAAAIKELDEDEVLVTSDVDMAVFQMPQYLNGDGFFTIFGADLTPQQQYPICYISAKVKDWRKTFGMGDKTPQECLDTLLGEIECDNMRGNYWGKDQEEAYNKIWLSAGVNIIPRARPGTQFASCRVDRDDAYWRRFVNGDLVDAHLWRPLYEASNFNNLMELMQTMYPNDDFSWLVQYAEEYRNLIK